MMYYHIAETLKPIQAEEVDIWEKIAVILNRSRDQYHLLLSQGKGTADTPYINIHIKLFENLFGLAAQLAIVHKQLSFHIHNRVIKHNILSHRQVGDQCRIHFLIHNLDAEFFRGYRCSKIYHLAIIKDFTSIPRISP